MNKINFKGSVMLNPTPVILVTSINKEGKTNVFTIGWVSTVCTKPPVIAVGIRPERLSYEYIKESEECVINLTTRDMVKITDYCGVVSGKREDKISKLGLVMGRLPFRTCVGASNSHFSIFVKLVNNICFDNGYLPQ